MTKHQDYKLSLQAFQSQRLHRDLVDLAAEPQYQQIGKFFFEEMYGSRNFSARDEQAERAHWFVHRVPGVTAHDIESVLDLLALTNRLDNEIADLLIQLGALDHLLRRRRLECIAVCAPDDVHGAVLDGATRLANRADRRRTDRLALCRGQHEDYDPHPSPPHKRMVISTLPAR